MNYSFLNSPLYVLLKSFNLELEFMLVTIQQLARYCVKKERRKERKGEKS